MNKISENIKKKRLENNLTQQEVAEKLYVTRQCISRWEQGITLPDINNIEKLAEIFNCNTNDIIDHDSIKIITISEAIKNRKTKKIILISILISLLAIWMSLLGILLINRNNKIDDSENIKYLRAIVFDINSDEIKFKLDKEQVPEDQSRDFVLPLTETLNIKVFNNFKKQIDLSELKLKDIVQLSYYNELNSQNIEVIHLIDSEVEKSFYGVIVVANGQHYESYEDIPTDGTPGIRFFLHEE